jgi:hypothetical protein
MKTVPGVYDLSHKVLKWSFIAAAAVGSASLIFGGVASSKSGTIGVLTAFAKALERSFALTSFVLLVGVLLFLLWFPVQVPRNLAVFSAAYLAFFGITVASLFVAYFIPSDRSAAGFMTKAVEGASVACYILWLVTLNRAGEEQPVRVGHIWKPADQQKLLQQLDAINATLLTGARR